jgi:hypothetical protein
MDDKEYSFSNPGAGKNMTDGKHPAERIRK